MNLKKAVFNVVSELILWATVEKGAAEIRWNGLPIIIG
jgi:hypothetical protein